MKTNTLVHWPTGASYPDEAFRVVIKRGRDVTIADDAGRTFTVHQSCIRKV